MLNALTESNKRKIFREVKNILNKYKLFGFILHDPKTHEEFHNSLKNSFELLDFSTGKDFLFFALTEPSKNWLERNRKNYGCSIITAPSSIIDRVSKFGKSYRELTIDTVKKFLSDSKDSNFKI